jgi:LmbE family N-acetylglucosaminyl deacetylase
MKHDLVTRIVGRVLVLLESADAPSDPEWDRCLGLLAEFRDDFSRVKVLVITAGGGPTPPQRRRLSAVTQEHSVHVAVVSDSMRVRFIVASAALFLREIATFRRAEIAMAYRHLGLDPAEQRAVEIAVQEMTDQLGSSRA